MIKTTVTQEYSPQFEIDKARKLQKKQEKLLAYELEMRLQEWGRWLAKCLDNGLGYSPRSITSAAFEGSRSTVPTYPPDNAFAESVHDAFLKLAKTHYEWACVLKSEYVRSKLELDHDMKVALSRAENMKLRAKRLGMTYGNYKVILRMAKSYIEGHITG